MNQASSFQTRRRKRNSCPMNTARTTPRSWITIRTVRRKPNHQALEALVLERNPSDIGEGNAACRTPTTRPGKRRLWEDIVQCVQRNGRDDTGWKEARERQVHDQSFGTVNRGTSEVHFRIFRSGGVTQRCPPGTGQMCDRPVTVWGRKHAPVEDVQLCKLWLCWKSGTHFARER